VREYDQMGNVMGNGEADPLPLTDDQKRQVLSLCTQSTLAPILKVVREYAAMRGADKALSTDERRLYKKLVARLDRPITWSEEHML